MRSCLPLRHVGLGFSARLNNLLLGIVILALSACGGGSSDGSAPSSMAPPIRFSTDFASGSIGTITPLNGAQGREWDLALRNDNQDASLPDNFRTWWYVRADNLPVNQAMHLEFSNLGWANYFVPIYSYDGKTWQYFNDQDVSLASGCTASTLKLCKLVVKARFSAPTVWIARTHPYTQADLESFLQSIATRPQIRIETLGLSPQLNLPIKLITLHDSATATAKKTVWIHARTHAAETGPSFVLEGLIAAYLANDATGQGLRERFIFKIAPLHNADGVALGNYRTNASSINLESNWHFFSGSLPLRADAPLENRLLNSRMSAALQDTQAPVVLALNLHSSNSSPDTAAFLFPHFGSDPLKYSVAERHLWVKQIGFIATLAGEYGGRIEQPPAEGGRNFLNSAFPEAWWWQHKQDGVNAITLETTFGRAGFDHWISQTDLRELGAAVARTILKQATPATLKMQAMRPSIEPPVSPYRLPFKPEIYQDEH